MTTETEAAISNILTQADGLASSILAAGVPDINEYRALTGLSNLARGTGLFSLRPEHEAALRCSPPAADMLEWFNQERRMARG